MKIKIKKIWIIRFLICCLIMVLFGLQQNELSKKYQKGLEYEKAGDYQNAMLIMNSIAEYKDAPNKTKEFQAELDYQAGLALIAEKNWEEAQKQFELVLSFDTEYKDVQNMKNLTIYEQARTLALNGDVHSAELLFLRLPSDYSDVAERKTVIKENKKFAGKYQCTTLDIELNVQVYIDYNNIARVRTKMQDNEGFLLDEPVSLNGEGMEINIDRFSWAIYGDDSFSFVYNDGQYTVMRQPVTEGTVKHIFKKVVGANYDAINASYTSTDF